MEILYILGVFTTVIYAFFKYKKALHMLQQNWYNLGNRYLKWLKNNLNKVFSVLEILAILLFLPFNNYAKLVLINVILILLILIYYRRQKVEQTKLKLAVTKRVKRLILTSSLFYFIPLVITMFLKLDFTVYLMYCLILTILTPLIVVIANIVNIPVEKFVFLYYKKQAVSKLDNMSNMSVIGVTGSYGKTSSKNILYDVLNIKFNVFKTPKNFNTTYGLINSVNNYLDKFSDYFIAEMGAFKKGEIKEICDLMHPKYGILTTIGTAHLESFGSRENIMKGKFELIESLPSDGIGILNMDDPYQTKYELKNDCKILWISTKNKDADLFGTNIKLTSRGTEFDLIFKGDKTKYHFETCLLGEHNVYNIMAAVLLGYNLGISIDRLQTSVSRVEPIEHRLELKSFIPNVTIIDDAYNSNPTGAKMAVEVLGLMEGRRVVVTPGMIELGDEQYSSNFEFGRQIAQVADIVILVGETQTKPIYDGLVKEQFNEKETIIINDVKEAFSIIKGLSDKETFVLLENDLPDMFNE